MHSSDPRRRSALLIAVAALLLPLAAPLAARADGDDPNGVGVARLSLVDGSVAVQRGDSAAPIDAAVNAPVLPADYVTTGDASHAEVQFDGMSTVRLGDNVQMRFTRIDPGNRQLQLAQGTIEMRLLRGTDGENDIDTPSVSIHPLDTGSYRVTVDSDGRTLLTVRAGQAEVVMPQGNQVVSAGSTLLAQGPASSPSVQPVETVAVDDFDNFNRDCDQREAPALASEPYVNPQVPGVADLDADGRWVQDNSYGQVWVPQNVASDWAPYRDGSWVWEDYYGWTWVGYEPWGWAPYHYGRWYHSPVYGWAWYPGSRLAVSAWSPALVAFIGFGGGGGIGLGFGNIGWVPLAPFEAFHPWWGRGVGNVAFTNNYYNAPVYRNALYNGATFVSHERFLQGRFDHASPMTVAQVREGQVVRGAVPVVPTQANLRFNDRPAPANLAVRSSAFAERSFAGHENVVQRTPFEQQRAAFTTGVGARPNATYNGETGARPNATYYGETGARQNATVPNNAWSRFNTQRPTSDGERPTYNAERPSYSGTGTRNADTTNRSTTTYQRPSTYNEGSNGYQRPSYSQGSNNGYQRPSYSQGSNNGYQRPSYNQGSNNGYQRPSYSQGSNGYQRPSYNQGSNGYQRPSYNQGSNTYQRSTSTYRQPSYSRPTQTYQRQPQRTQQSSRQASPRPRSSSDRDH